MLMHLLGHFCMNTEVAVSKSKGNKLPLIVGIAVGGAVLVAVVLLLIIVITKRKRKTKKTEERSRSFG